LRINCEKFFVGCQPFEGLAIVHAFMRKILFDVQILDDASPALSGMDSIATARTTKNTFDVKKLLP
jgi:hypothetical protein